MAYSFEVNNGDFLQHINGENFENIALSIFRYQYENNIIYKQYTDTIGKNPAAITTVDKIPFLPISFFKTHKVVTGRFDTTALIFESSGTTGEIPSRHYVYSEHIYERSLLQGFQQFYGKPSNYAIVALLPSYLERQTASLVHMAKVLMRESGHTACGFYLNEWDKLAEVLQQLENDGQPTLLLGVTFALLDFAENYPMKLGNTIVMETGGMKGRRQEWTRAEVHSFLKQQWGLRHIHSEYGMTELLSQSYSKGEGLFRPSATMKVLVNDLNDPLDVQTTGTGCLNIIDLADIHSCSFIATEDIGIVNPDNSFEVLGRMDHSALRGCSLMAL